jgi:hypothetical protein
VTLAKRSNKLAAQTSNGQTLILTKSIIRSVVDELELSLGVMTPAFALELIRDELLPNTLFRSDCLCYPALYRKLRDMLICLEIQVESESENQSVSLKVALTVRGHI